MKHANVAFFVPMVGCPHRCSFCDQTSITGQSSIPSPSDVDETLKRASRELRGFKDKTEIAFFGGSFTMIPRDIMVSLLEPASKWVKRGAFSGIRLSTRPDAINDEILTLLKDYGVTSIELGAQSSSDSVLSKNLRGHKFEDTVRSAQLIKDYGFSLGLQMMTGMPGSAKDLDIKTAVDFVKLKPDTMRIYPALTIKNTLMAKWYEEGSYIPQTVDEAAALCADLLDIFELYKIPVIKLGLHAEQSLENNLVAGPYHPAFHEICESIRFRKKIDPMIKKLDKGNYILLCNPKDISVCTGQHRSNLDFWESLGYNITVKADQSLNKGDFSVMADTLKLI